MLNDEAHHCYREKPREADEEELKGDDKKEAEKDNEVPAFGFPASKRCIENWALPASLSSPSPFFLRGSGYHHSDTF